MTLLFRDTKAGFDVRSALPETLRPELEQYLGWRHEQVSAGRVGPGSDEKLFLTPKGRPYKDNRGRWGTQNKSAFNSAKKRAAKLLEQGHYRVIAAAKEKGDEKDMTRLQRRRADVLRVVAALTQHWFRHKLGTELGRKDPRAAMMQGGWRDARSLAGYMRDDAEYQRSLVEQRGLADTNLARGGLDDERK